MIRYLFFAIIFISLNIFAGAKHESAAVAALLHRLEKSGYDPALYEDFVSRISDIDIYQAVDTLVSRHVMVSPQDAEKLLEVFGPYQTQVLSALADKGDYNWRLLERTGQMTYLDLVLKVKNEFQMKAILEAIYSAELSIFWNAEKLLKVSNKFQVQALAATNELNLAFDLGESKHSVDFELALDAALSINKKEHLTFFKKLLKKGNLNNESVKKVQCLGIY